MAGPLPGILFIWSMNPFTSHRDPSPSRNGGDHFPFQYTEININVKVGVLKGDYVT
jgi:hypothetical protein